MSIFDEISYEKSDFGMPTPDYMVEAMLDLLPDSFWGNPNARVLEVNTKDRGFLDACFKRFRARLSVPDSYIWSMLHCAYTFGPLGMLFRYELPKQVNIGAWKDMKLSDVKFDLVVGNPPYNRDAYLDFVMKGHELSSKYSLWITPAKWQVKEDLKEGGANWRFRQELVPHIRNLYYEPIAANIFEGIHLAGGVTYFLADKEFHKDKTINDTYVQGWQIEYGFNIQAAGIAAQVHAINPKSIIDGAARFVPKKSYFSSRQFGDNPDRYDYPVEDSTSRFYLCSSKESRQVEEKAFKHYEDMDKWKVYIMLFISPSFVPWLIQPNYAMQCGSCLLGYGTKEECESIISYYSCKLIWYLVNMLSTNNANTYAFKLVPDPGAFDHIFTDEELYAKYNITDDQIKIIESVIRR